MAASQQICCVTSCAFDEKRATKPKFVAQTIGDLVSKETVCCVGGKVKH